MAKSHHPARQLPVESRLCPFLDVQEIRMGTPLFAFDALFTPLQRFARFVARRRTSSNAPGAPAAPSRACAIARPLPAAVQSAPRRLRVVRVIESSHAAAHAGRMVISGRMADVCAELDRLAALEAAAG
jgi:hypothetical protein